MLLFREEEGDFREVHVHLDLRLVQAIFVPKEPHMGGERTLIEKGVLIDLDLSVLVSQIQTHCELVHLAHLVKQLV